MDIRIFFLAVLGFALAAGPVEAQWAWKPFTQKTMPKAKKAPKPATAEALKKQQHAMWDVGDKALNKALGYLPGPTGAIGGYAFATGVSVVANVSYTAARVSFMEGRELGHGEVWGTIFATLNPLPVPIPALYQAGVAAWKGKDLCKREEYRDYPGLSQPEHDLVPKAARASWYGQRWCGYMRDTRYDALLADAGMTKRIFANTPRAVPPRGRVTIGPIIISMVATPTPEVSWEAPSPNPLLTKCGWARFDTDGNKVVEDGCS